MPGVAGCFADVREVVAGLPPPCRDLKVLVDVFVDVDQGLPQHIGGAGVVGEVRQPVLVWFGAGKLTVQTHQKQSGGGGKIVSARGQVV